MASKRAIESCWPTPASEPEAELIAWEETIALKRALDRLDEEERLLVTLSAYQGLDSKEIGGLVGRPPGTIRYQLHAAREKLRSILLENRSHDRQA